MGQSTCIELVRPYQWNKFYRLFRTLKDEETKSIVMIGEIGGMAEEEGRFSKKREN